VDAFDRAVEEARNLIIPDRRLANEVDSLSIFRTLRSLGGPVVVVGALPRTDNRVRGFKV
jgi:DNA-binding response OmpR family regulator